MSDAPNTKLDQWKALAARELKTRTPDDLTWETPEGIAVKPLYTQDDLAGIGHLGSLPGEVPFVRGPRATMYPVDAVRELDIIDNADNRTIGLHIVNSGSVLNQFLARREP